MLKLRLDHVFDMRASFGGETRIGPTTLAQSRTFVPVTSGRVLGPRLSGEIVAGSGGDWPRLEDGRALIEGQWLIRADDGTLIVMRNTGYLQQTLPAGAAWRGEGADYATPTLHLAPIFEAPEGPHGWLTRTVFVGKADRRATDANFRFYAVM